ncbi:MAG TPA: fumarylacetoacetate hydrolase family protein [Pseudonocardiaceae bacterium]
MTGSGEGERPEGTELLAFEGEIALVIGKPARHVRPEDGWSHVDWVTAANDLGLQDLRTADRGSNVRSRAATVTRRSARNCSGRGTGSGHAAGMHLARR